MANPATSVPAARSNKQVLEDHLVADRERETNALLLARLLQGKVRELREARDEERRVATRLRRTARLNPAVRQGGLGQGGLRLARMRQSEDAWTKSKEYERELGEAIVELKDSIDEINRIAGRRQLTEKALGLPVGGARYTINMHGPDSNYFEMNDRELDDQSRIEELMLRQVSLARDRR